MKASLYIGSWYILSGTIIAVGSNSNKYLSWIIWNAPLGISNRT